MMHWYRMATCETFPALFWACIAAEGAAQVPGLSVIRFILSGDERNQQVEREVRLIAQREPPCTPALFI